VAKFLLHDLIIIGLEFGIWQAIQGLAVEEWRGEVLQRAGKVGKAKGDLQRNYEKFRPLKFTYAGFDEKMKPAERITKAYQWAAKREFRKLWQKGPDHPIKIRVSRYELLKACGAVDSKKNTDQVEELIKRRMHPFKIGRTIYPALILGFEKDEKLRKCDILVNQVYLCGKEQHYKTVPVPFPMKYENVFKAFAFLHWLNTDDGKTQKAYSKNALWNRVGVDRRYEAYAEKHWKQILSAVNNHLLSIGQYYEFIVVEGNGGDDLMVRRRFLEKPAAQIKEINPKSKSQPKLPPPAEPMFPTYDYEREERQRQFKQAEQEASFERNDRQWLERRKPRINPGKSLFGRLMDGE
jgi:hypothetical protein